MPPKRSRLREARRWLRWHLPEAILGVVVAVLAVALVAKITSGHRASSPLPTGEIESPAAGELVSKGHRLAGTLSGLPKDQDAWLAVRREDGMAWLIQQLRRDRRRWQSVLPDHAPRGEPLSLLLFTVRSSGRERITQWIAEWTAELQRAARILSTRQEVAAAQPVQGWHSLYLPLREVADRTTLDAVAGVVVTKDASGDPLALVFPQSRASRGSQFDFTNATRVLSGSFSQAPDCHRSQRGAGLRLKWDMRNGGSGGWGVHWTDPPGAFDASAFASLRLSVRGAHGGETFQVGLKDTSDREVKVESRDRFVVSRHKWKALIVPLAAFDGVDRRKSENLNLGFNDDHGHGELCVDEIAFR